MTLEEAIEYVKTLTEDQQRVFEIGTVCGRSIQAQSSVDRAVNAMDDSALLQQALEKLEFFAHMKGASEDTRRLITALRERLKRQEQKTCLVANESCKHGSWCSEVYCQEHCKFVEQSAQPEPVKFNCTVVDDAHPEGVPLSQWGRQPLTLREIERCIHDANNDPIVACRNVEAAHGITGATP